MRFETFIGRRHLFNRERFIRVRLTTAISIVSVAIGVAALIVVIALLDGIDTEFHRKYMDLIGHIEVMPPDGSREDLFANPSEVANTLAGDPEIVAFAPQIQREAFLLPDRDLGVTKFAIQLLGVDTESMSQVARFVDRTTSGSGTPGEGEIVLGRILAQQLFVQPGDSVWAITRVAIDPLALMPHVRWQEFRVAGTFVTGIPDLDATTAYVNLPTARRAFVLPDDAVSEYLVRVDDPYAARDIAAGFMQRHPELGSQLRPWSETNAEFFHALRLEKLGTFVMLLMIILVASFNIIGTLVMIVTERTREIGILKTIGASDRDVHRIFLRSGLMIGVIGTTAGLVLGLGICVAIKLSPIDVQFLYDINSIPVLIRWTMVVLIAACSMSICLIASVLPAHVAARLDPVEALRHE